MRAVYSGRFRGCIALRQSAFGFRMPPPRDGLFKRDGNKRRKTNAGSIKIRIGVTLFGLAGAILLLSYGIVELIDDPELKEGLDIEKDVFDGAVMLALAAIALVGCIAVWFQRPRLEESIWDRLNGISWFLVPAIVSSTHMFEKVAFFWAPLIVLLIASALAYLQRTRLSSRQG